MKTDFIFGTFFSLAFILWPSFSPGIEKTGNEAVEKIHNQLANAQKSTKQFKLELKKRKVVLDPNVIKVQQGDSVSLIWESDEIATLHLHGYDIEFEVSPDKPKTINFIASATGRFAITGHSFSQQRLHSHEVLLYVEVYPK